MFALLIHYCNTAPLTLIQHPFSSQHNTTITKHHHKQHLDHIPAIQNTASKVIRVWNFPRVTRLGIILPTKQVLLSLPLLYKFSRSILRPDGLSGASLTWLFMSKWKNNVLVCLKETLSTERKWRLWMREREKKKKKERESSIRDCLCIARS